MISPATLNKMGLATQVSDLLSVGTRQQVMEYLRINQEFIFRDIVPRLRKFKERVVIDADKLYKKSKAKLGKIETKPPVWTTGMDMVEYANDVRHYLLQIPTALVYEQLHKFQEHVDMKILSPSEPVPRGFKYTIGNVFEFLNTGVRGNKSQLILSDPKKNPFWVPYRYDFEEGKLANQIDLIWKNYSLSKVIKNYNDTFKIYDSIGDENTESKLRAVLALLDFYRRILVISMNPGTMKKYSRNPETNELDQIGPMEAYKFANMDRIMERFSRRITRDQLGTIKALNVSTGVVKDY